MDFITWNRRHFGKAESPVLPGIADLLLGVAPTAPFCSLHQRQTRVSQTKDVSLSLSFRNQPSTEGANIRAPAPKRMALGGRGSYILPMTTSHPPSPPYTAAPSICLTSVGDIPSFEAGLDDLCKEKAPDATALTRLVAQMLDQSVAPAYGQGWYRPHSPQNKFSHRLETKISGLTKDDLVREFFHRNEARQAYGKQVTIPRRRERDQYHEKHDSVSFRTEETGGYDESDYEPFALATKPLCRQHETREEHKELERSRRDRHRDLQMQSALRSCDIAADCGEDHADEEKLMHGTRRTRGKGPGKDEQLFTAIYSHEFSARVVQSEHDGRKRAEQMVDLLLRCLVRGHNLKRGADLEHEDWGMRCSTSPDYRAYAGRKRPRSEVEDT